MPKYNIESSGYIYPCELKIKDTEYGPKYYTFFIEDPEQTTLQFQKSKDGVWLPAKNNYKVDWVTQLQLQVDSKNYW